MERIVLNEKEDIVYKFIYEFIKKNGYPPSVREICRITKIKSTASVYKYINNLKKKGYIEKTNLKNRALKIVEEEKENLVSIPIIGKVAAGEPILAMENIEDYLTIGESFFNTTSKKEDTFILRVQGDSMINVGINDKDYIIVSKQNFAKNGDIVVALIGDSSTVKTYYKENGYIRLQPENDSLDSIIVKDDNFCILGKVIGLFRKIN